MTRGTFANIRLKNQLVPGIEGGYTRHIPTGDKLSIFEAATLYKQAGTPLVVLAGKEYGTGSSRDWAAKGTLLLGVKAVIAESYERIHRSNLVGMGVLPLQFLEGQSASSLGLDGSEVISISGMNSGMAPGAALQVRAEKPDGIVIEFNVVTRLDTAVDVQIYQHGGILHKVLREKLNKTKPVSNN
jgi:aconitate hydratase